MPVTVNYESVADYVASVTDPNRRIPSDVYQAHADTGRRDFYWTETFADACRLQREGWSEGAEKVARHREGFNAFIQAASNAKARQQSWDVSGQWIDVGRYLTGEPECWGSETDGNTTMSRVVSIRLNNCVSAAVDPSTIVARGLAVLVAVDLLEACNVRCEVIVGTASRQDGDVVESNVIVKRAGDPAEPNAMAFNIAHPSFFRRFGFKFMELHGQSPCMNYPAPMRDVGKRPGVVEIDELLTGVKLNVASVRTNVLAIAEKCGLEFSREELNELIAAAGH